MQGCIFELFVKEFLVIVLVEFGSGEGFLVLPPLSDGFEKKMHERVIGEEEGCGRGSVRHDL
jgi:hypothetical protein